MALEGLDQAARPALALADELPPGGGGVGEQAGVFAVSDPVAGFEQGPGEDDVLAHHRPPAADLAQGVAAVDRKRALGDQRALVQGLDALHRGDAMEIVPFLDLGDEVGARVADHHRAGDRGGVRGVAEEAQDEVFERMPEQVGVAIHGDHVGGVHRPQAGVEGGGFARIARQVDHAEPGVAGAQALQDGGGAIGGAVVDDDDAEFAGIGLQRDALEGVLDRVLLVVGSDEDRQGGERGGTVLECRAVVEKQAGDHERVHESGQEGDAEDDEVGSAGADMQGECGDPRRGDAIGQDAPGQSGGQRERELGANREVAPSARCRGGGRKRCRHGCRVGRGSRPGG